MKIISTAILAIAITASAWAVPAKRVRKTLTQPDGTTLTATLCGDEHQSFYIDGHGQRLRQNADGYWTALQAAEVTAQDRQWQARRKKRSADMAGTNVVPSIGEHRLLAILVQFSNLKFSAIGSQSHFENMLNGENYDFQGATGSAQQYFQDQSLGKYKPVFDIIGPVTLDNPYRYYGANSPTTGTDLRPREMVADAVKKAVEQGLISDFSLYDGNSDGYVDLVYVFYAGFSESEGAGDNFIWPHAWNLSPTLNYGGIKISKYACSSELMGTPEDQENLQMDGIGSCVHEFSHCLGLPDFYNTGTKSGCYGMDAWSVMDQGCYNNDGKTPPGYTAFERESVGWMEITPLPASGDIALAPIESSNQALVYKNPANENERFIFENHQNQGWDTYFGKFQQHGLLITHVDYDAAAWEYNMVNNDPAHQRYTVVPADGTLDCLTASTQEAYITWKNSFLGDIWPGPSAAVRFNKGTTPAAAFFTGAPATFDITDIAKTPDGIITFHVKPFNGNDSGLTQTEEDSNVGKYVDVYDLAGRRILAGIPYKHIDSASLPGRGIYLIDDGRTIRKIFIR